MKIKSGDINGTVLHVDQVGTTNGAIDTKYQMDTYPQMAYNNTYGLQVINETVYEAALRKYNKPRGCKAKIERCRELAKQYDLEQLATNATVNAVCRRAQNYCFGQVTGAFTAYSLVEPVGTARSDPPSVHHNTTICC